MGLAGEKSRPTAPVGDCATPISVTDEAMGQKAGTDGEEPTPADLLHVGQTSHPVTPEHTAFPRAHGTETQVGWILGHKTSLSKFKRIEITQHVFLDTMDSNWNSITERQQENL